MIKKFNCVLLLIAFLFVSILPMAGIETAVSVQAANSVPNVVPSLREWTGGTGNFTINSSSRICVDPTYSAQLTDAANAFKTDMGSITGLTLNVVNTAQAAAGDFFLTLNCTDTGIGNEGYIFEVGTAATIRANTARGIIYGTKTAMQILKQDSVKANIPQGTARDYPKYKERALMIDVARKFFPFDYLKEYVKQLSWFKMNDFHIHFNDDWGNYQAFRMQCDTYPALTATDGSYTKAQLRELQDLAKQYGVTITPEIDSPGHSKCFTTLRPDLASPYGASYLDLNNPNTYTFMNSIFDEFVPIFDAPDFHIGTDEYDSRIGDVFRQYINRYNDYIKAKGKKTRIWTGYQNISGTTQPNTDITIDVWESGVNAANLVNQGYNVINSNGDVLYIVPGSSWVASPTTIYENWQPNWFNSSGSNSVAADNPRLLGAKLHNWNDNNAYGKTLAEIDQLIEPCLKALAEQVWGGPKSSSYIAFKSRTALVGSAPGLVNIGAPEAAPKPGNLALGKTATASSVESNTSFTAAKAFDDDTTTRWASGYSDPQWIYVDLGQPVTFDNVTLNWEAAYATSYKVQVSDDASSWADVYSTTAGNGGVDDIKFQAVTKRYVRMYGVSRATSWGYSLWEFGVYNSSGGQVPQPANLAVNKTSSADSQETANTAAKGNDGSGTTRWCAANGNTGHWWKVDLGQNYNLTGSEVNWEFGNKVYKYKVEVSTDNTNWTVAVGKTNNTSTSQVQSDSFTASARYVRITVTGLASGCWASFWEFKVFGN